MLITIETKDSAFLVDIKIVLADIERKQMFLLLQEGVNLVVTTNSEMKQCDESFRRTKLQPFQIGYTPESDLLGITNDLAD